MRAVRQVPRLVQGVEHRRRVFAGLRVDGGDASLQCLCLGCHFTDVFHVVPVAHPPGDVGSDEGERAGRHSGPAYPFELALSGQITTGNKVFLKDDLLQQVLQKKTFAGAGGSLCREHFTGHTESALHGPQHAIKGRALLRARSEIHASYHRLFRKFGLAEYRSQQARQHITNPRELLRQRVGQCSPRQIRLVEEALLHAVVQSFVEQIKLATERFTNRDGRGRGGIIGQRKAPDLSAILPGVIQEVFREPR